MQKNIARRMKSKLFIFLLFGLVAVFNAQKTSDLDLKLAKNYYLEGDFEKAVLYFEKISKDQEKIKEIYDYYRASLIELEAFNEAEKLCKSIIKKSPENLALLVDLGMIFGYQDKLAKKTQQFEKAINSISSKSSYSTVSGLGIAFEKVGDQGRALSTYLKGSKVNINNPMAYHSKIALLYNKMGEIDKMINTFLELLEEDEKYIAAVQNGLANSIDFQVQLKEKEILRKALVKKVQLNPKKIKYVKILSWFYLLDNDYENAFIQIKALDKKLNKDGREIYNLGLTSLNNNNFKVALLCFDEVLENTKSIERKFSAENKRLKTLKQKLIYGGEITENELLELKSNYLQSLYKLNVSSGMYDLSKRKYELLKELSDLEAYYLMDRKSAKEHLNEAMKISDINEKDKAELKLQLADVLVLENNIWEASLMYMQIEKMFKNDPLGHQAKFKNAQVYYYAGEFDWCQAQLDVLKASTSKLIANDALELSVLITDNFNMDTSETAMKLFARADMFKNQFQYKEAMNLYDSVYDNFENHSLSDEILLRKAKITLKLHQYDSSLIYLKLIEENFSTSILVDNAIFMLGNIYEERLRDLNLAKEYYKKILFDFPGSLYVIEARKRYRKLAGNTNQDIIKDS